MLGLVLRESMLLVAIGVVIGIAASLAAGRLVASQLFGLEPTDPPTMAAAMFVMLAVSAAAGYLPARRAARVDPMIALQIRIEEESEIADWQIGRLPDYDEGSNIAACATGCLCRRPGGFAGSARRRSSQGATTRRNAPTFSKDVAPILYKHCVSCHRPGEIGRMSLLTYEQARPYAKAIANAVTNRTMPPWHADAPAGTFHNERSLSDRERETLTAWAAGGAINGDPKDLPAQPTFSDGWSLGKPDVVLEMLEEYRVPAKGTIQYEWFYIPTNFTEPKWVKSIEIRPGNRGAVHHVLVYYRAKPDRQDAADRARQT